MAIISSCFRRNKNRETKVLGFLGYMFHGSCRRVPRVLSLALEPMSRSTIHDLAKRELMIKIA